MPQPPSCLSPGIPGSISHVGRQKPDVVTDASPGSQATGGLALKAMRPAPSPPATHDTGHGILPAQNGASQKNVADSQRPPPPWAEERALEAAHTSFAYTKPTNFVGRGRTRQGPHWLLSIPPRPLAPPSLPSAGAYEPRDAILQLRLPIGQSAFHHPFKAPESRPLLPCPGSAADR